MADINALVAGDANAFEALVAALMAAENDQRARAEQALAELKKHPDACISQLVRSLRTSPSLQSRALCAVLLRKVINPAPTAPSLPERRRDGAMLLCRPARPHSLTALRLF